ncbi:hypothetical protein MSG28_013755 [Choristoneura fumiferana]|uniref:Uncharacterized protein n=1 Tax=Choristoneura fumiferana TaxID=7141 RepID=A0ACC0K969_CHOFU|nr:hypothetical protein MSG28_013755 [Choristoneura fumiferana]
MVPRNRRNTTSFSQKAALAMVPISSRGTRTTNELNDCDGVMQTRHIQCRIRRGWPQPGAWIRFCRATLTLAKFLASLAFILHQCEPLLIHFIAQGLVRRRSSPRFSSLRRRRRPAGRGGSAGRVSIPAPSWLLVNCQWRGVNIIVRHSEKSPHSKMIYCSLIIIIIITTMNYNSPLASTARNSHDVSFSVLPWTTNCMKLRFRKAEPADPWHNGSVCLTNALLEKPTMRNGQCLCHALLINRHLFKQQKFTQPTGIADEACPGVHTWTYGCEIRIRWNTGAFGCEIRIRWKPSGGGGSMDFCQGNQSEIGKTHCVAVINGAAPECGTLLLRCATRCRIDGQVFSAVYCTMWQSAVLRRRAISRTGGYYETGKSRASAWPAPRRLKLRRRTMAQSNHGDVDVAAREVFPGHDD